MSTVFRLPQMGMGMQEGTVVEWLKQEGDAVTEGDPLVIVEVAKSETELEAPASGVLEEIFAPAGETVPVREVLCIIATVGSKQ